MSCKRSLDREFLSMHLSKTWLLTTYKQHRERVLLEREMALLPATQDVLQNYKYCGKLEEELKQLDERRHAYLSMLHVMTRRMGQIRHAIDAMRASNYVDRPANHAPEPQRERRQFIRGCPVEGCRGFLSSAWKCGTCDTWVCKDCGERKADGQVHECDPNVAASHALMQKDSRPCPQCASMIFKVSGCSQIWCTQCHVAFDWHTGAVVTNGVIHNPHYYEWLRQTRGNVPRNPDDVPCGGMPSAREVEFITRKFNMPRDHTNLLKNTHRIVGHMRGVDIPALRREARDGPQRNVDLRLQYLLHAIDAEEWRKKLQQREKKRERALATLQVYDMFCAAATDLYRNMMDAMDESNGPGETVDNVQRLIEFTEQHLDTISKRFNMRVKRVRFI